jgi:hypothetical protein
MNGHEAKVEPRAWRSPFEGERLFDVLLAGAED